jgi:adenine-specific DNA methylase
MNFKELESKQKLRGGYYTPFPIAEVLSNWALSNGATTILEPSCGDGIFLEAIYKRVLTTAQPSALSIDAVEIIEEEAAKSELFSGKLRDAGAKVQVINHDIFSWLGNGNAGRKWDAIIGNPPYIRYQYFEKNQREQAEQLFKKANVPFSKRTNAWVPLVIASIMHLAPGGRLAMVLPAELLHIHHASGLRQLLEQEMETVILINIREMVFPGVLQGVVLMLAAKKHDRDFKPLLRINTSQHVNFSQASFLADDPDEPARIQILDLNILGNLKDLNLKEIEKTAHQNINDTDGEWMLGLLTDEEATLMKKIKERKDVPSFASVASVDIGIVTGANDFFVVDETTLKRYELETIATPMLAKSDLIKGVVYTLQDHESNVQAGKSVYLLNFPAKALADLPAAMAEYIKIGESQKLHERYKCRIREPWYVVPYIWTSEVSLLKRCHFFPKLVVNELRAHSTDTAYRIRLEPGYEERAKDLVFSFLNSLTFLCAEVGGRHYGGGVLELVPSEIEKLLIPLIPIEESAFAQVDTMIRNNATLDELLDFTDSIILSKGLGLTQQEIHIIEKAHERLLKRRLRS